MLVKKFYESLQSVHRLTGDYKYKVKSTLHRTVSSFSKTESEPIYKKPPPKPREVRYRVNPRDFKIDTYIKAI